MQFIMKYSNAISFSKMKCNAVKCFATQYNAMSCSKMRCNATHAIQCNVTGGWRVVGRVAVVTMNGAIGGGTCAVLLNLFQFKFRKYILDIGDFTAGEFEIRLCWFLSQGAAFSTGFVNQSVCQFVRQSYFKQICKIYVCDVIIKLSSNDKISNCFCKPFNPHANCHKLRHFWSKLKDCGCVPLYSWWCWRYFWCQVSSNLRKAFRFILFCLFRYIRWSCCHYSTSQPHSTLERFSYWCYWSNHCFIM